MQSAQKVPAASNDMYKRPANNKVVEPHGESDDGVKSDEEDGPTHTSKRLKPDEKSCVQTHVEDSEQPLGWPAKALWKADAGAWTERGPNGGKVQVISYQRAFFVATAQKGERHISWNKHGGVAAAWTKAKRLANW